MAKARRLITENMKAVDVAAELLDARIPYSSANPMIAELTAGKPRLIILNKSDMADPGETKKWKDWFQSQGLKTIAMDSRTGKSRKMLFQAVREAAGPVLKKWEARGMKNRSVRLMILGIPNVGKSTLINSLSGTAAARTANTPGHTRGKQWVHLADGLDLLDTPGVLWPKLDNQTAAVRLAATGAIADDVFDLETVVPALLKMLTEKAPENWLSGTGQTRQSMTETVFWKKLPGAGDVFCREAPSTGNGPGGLLSMTFRTGVWEN